MPHMTGTDLIRRLRKLRISLPVILISGGGADRSSEGIDCYLQKPYTQQELAEAIRQVIDSDPNEAIDNPGVA
jgi:FixJ family two-component response regulator